MTVDRKAMEDTDPQTQEAKTAVSNKDWVKGEELWQKLVLNNPQKPDMMTGLAFVYENTNRLQESLDLIVRAYDLAVEMKYPRLAGIMLPKARVLSKLGRSNEALVVLDEALQRMPKYRAALSLQIKIARELGQKDVLLGSLSRLSRELNQADTYCEYATELRNQKHYGMAMTQINKAIELQPEWPRFKKFRNQLEIEWVSYFQVGQSVGPTRKGFHRLD